MPFNIGIWEMLILLLVLLLIFGPKRLPEMGRSLGKSLREFKESISGDDDRDRDSSMTAAEPAELPPAPVIPVQPAPTPAPVPRDAQAGEPDRTS